MAAVFFGVLLAQLSLVSSDHWNAANISHIFEGDADNFAFRRLLVNPEENMNFCEISKYHGYKCEEYLNKIETEDGFLLTLQRLTGRQNSSSTPGYPVYLQHGLLCDSSSWILNPHTEDNLPFVLSDLGYDVWVGNSRGNTYSCKHKTLKPDQKQFWAWSWDEMAQFDLPASIDFVLSSTGYKTLYYIGHSQGTLIAFVHLATSYTDKISHMIALGPVFDVGHMTSPLKYLAPWSKDIDLLFKLLGVKDFLPHTKFLDWLVDISCNKHNPIKAICSNILFLLCGYDIKQLNQTRIPVYVSHAPAGTSVQNMVHFTQMISTDQCSRFDYGSAEANRKHYNQDTPPHYEISRINSTKISLMWAQNDRLADPQDVKIIRDTVRVISDDIYIPHWNHLDFLWALDVHDVMITKIIKILKSL